MSIDPGPPAAQGSTARQRALAELESAILLPDYEVIGTLRGSLVVARRLRGQSNCSPALALAAAELVTAGTVLYDEGAKRSIVACLTGPDLHVVLTLMRSMDTISSVSLGDVTVCVAREQGGV